MHEINTYVKRKRFEDYGMCKNLNFNLTYIGLFLNWELARQSHIAEI